MPGTNLDWGIFVVGTGHGNGMVVARPTIIMEVRADSKNGYIAYCKELPVFLKNGFQNRLATALVY